MDLSIATLTRQYRDGELTPGDVINRIYDRIESARPQPVWIHVVPRSDALRRADQLKPGPLYGIPFAVKDNIDVADLPTTAGCPAYSYLPDQTARVVEALLDAGGILVGKTNMDQFATGLVGTRSPFGACSSVFNPEYVSGGSSSGSAVAVASGLVSFALGTDTAGSGRVPAAFNNLVGLKPSRGLLSATGVVPACRSLDCVSIFALNAADAAVAFESARRFDPADPYSRRWPSRTPLSSMPLRCGVPKPDQLEFFGDRDSAALYVEAVEKAAALGADILEFDIASFRSAAELLYSGPYVAERFAAVGKFVTENRDEVEPTVGAIIAGASRYSAADAFNAQYKLESLRRVANQIWETVDVVLLPTAPTIYKIKDVLANPIALNSNLGIYTNFVNLLDLSAVAVPAGFRPDGLPFGVSLIAPAFADEMLLWFASKMQPNGPAFQPPQRGWVKLAVVGAHLSGMPLNSQLTDRGSRLWKTTRTAADYKLYALDGTVPPKPGLIRTPGFSGPGIEVEVWLMPESEFGSFVYLVPPPLSIGSCQLADGETVKGFVCEGYAAAQSTEITEYGGWRNYLMR